ncbi:unnamed protein product [Scytosiphon promiscuus]
MCDSEEVWQVAGNRRRRHRPGSSEAERKQQQQQQQQPEMRRRPARQTHDSAASSGSTAGKSRSTASLGGYSYKATRKSSVPQQTVESEEELVRQELAKLERIKLLLRGTALWQRLVAGLEEVLPQLGLAPPEEDGTSATAADGVGSVCPGRSTVDDVASSGFVSDRQCSPLELRELVCYGIGNFSENHSSRYQFALALCLHDFLSQRRNDLGTTAPEAAGDSCRERRRTSSGLEESHAQHHLDNESARSSTARTTSSAEASAAAVGADDCPTPGSGLSHQGAARVQDARRVSMLVFDPVMGKTERAILDALDCGTLENEEGKRRCCGTRGAAGTQQGGCGAGSGGEGGNDTVTPTLFFMPHCPQRLYSNVLWANWSSRALGSIIILGNKISRYREDRLLDTRARDDPTNALLRAGPLLRDIDLQVPYPASAANPEDKGKWRRDSEKLPRLERAFNDLALSFSNPDARGSAEGVAALRERPLEFVEDADGELVTGRAGT